MSELTDWLFEKTPSIDDDPPASTHISGQPFISDDDEWLDPPAESYDLEEVFAVMEYCNANDEVSRRRVTFRKISQGKHAPILQAFCHERRALRSFRTDRIECFIEETGEVIEATPFIEQHTGIDLAFLTPDNTSPRTMVPTASRQARQVRDQLRAPLSVLVAIARADGAYLEEELTAICKFIETVAPEIHKPAHPGEVSAQADIRDLARKMRPSREALRGYMHDVRALIGIDPELRDAFETAVGDVVWADGRFAKRERTLLEELGFDFD